MAEISLDNSFEYCIVKLGSMYWSPWWPAVCRLQYTFASSIDVGPELTIRSLIAPHPAFSGVAEPTGLLSMQRAAAPRRIFNQCKLMRVP